MPRPMSEYGMGKKSGSQTVDKSPWGPSQPNLEFALSQLPSAFSMAGGVQQPTDYGMTALAAPQLQRTISGDMMLNNPYLTDVIQRAMNDVNSQFERGSRYGSGAHMDTLFTKAAAPFRYSNYQQERQNQLAAVQAAPGFDQSAYNLYSSQVAAPYENVRNYAGIAGGIGGQGGEQTSPIYKNQLAGALGGAALGAGVGTAAGATSLMGTAATAGAAAVPALWPYLLGGALLGGLS